MEVFYLFVCIICFFWGILQIILFFKIWDMADDVRKLTEDVRKLVNHFCEPGQSDVNEEQKSIIYDNRLDSLKKGDKVKRKSDGKILTVKEIGKNTIFCKGGIFDIDYRKDALEYIEQ